MMVSQYKPTSKRRRDEGHVTPGSQRAWTVLRGRRALLQRLVVRGVGTLADVRASLLIPSGVDPRCLGAVPRGLDRIIARDGDTVTGRPVAHARRVARWSLVDVEAALAWLRDHPDPDVMLERAVNTLTRADRRRLRESTLLHRRRCGLGPGGEAMDRSGPELLGGILRRLVPMILARREA